MALFGRKSIAGVEIDSYEVRAVEIGGSIGSPVVMTAGRVALPEGVVKDGRVLKPDVVGNALTRVWAEAGIKTKDVILGISNQDVLLRFAFFPKVPPDKQNNMIKFQAQDFLPIPINEVELDYMVLGEISGEHGAMLHVLLVAARKAMINEFVNAINAADLNIIDIDASNLALMRLLPGNERNKAVAVISMTNEQTGVIILKNGIPGLARVVMMNSYNKGVERSLDDAEAYSQIAASGEEQESALINLTLLGEIKSSIAYFQNQTQNTTVEKVFLCGNVGGKKGVLGELHESLGLSVEMIDPLRMVGKNSLGKKIPSSETADYAICLSLALRGLEGGK